MRTRRSPHAAVLVLTASLGMLSCAQPTAPSTASDGTTRVLFIGNSLTAANYLPGLFQIVAEAGGAKIATRAVVYGGYSLEDHWVNGDALKEIRRGWADFVVLQQGPSSLPENQAHLRTWVGRFAAEIRTAGATPAVYMVWPERARSDAFPEVVHSYAAAAEASDAVLVPAGAAWLIAWTTMPDLSLYGPDDFHPSRLGSVVVALTLYGALLDRPVQTLPPHLVPVSPGLGVIDLDPEVAAVVFEAVEAAIRTSGHLVVK